MNYFDAMDYPGMIAEYGRPEQFHGPHSSGSAATNCAPIQNRRFLTVMAFAWKVPFYRRLWGAQGIEPGDIRVARRHRQAADLCQVRPDGLASRRIRRSATSTGWMPIRQADRPPLIFQTTSGTTGRPQPLLFGPKSREIQNLLLARFYALQGIAQRDVIHSVYGHGMVNGGHYVREAVLHWIGAQMLTAGTGVETRSANAGQPDEGFRRDRAVGFGDYIKRLSEVAREMGLEPGKDIPIRMISGHLGAESHEAMSAAWGGAQGVRLVRRRRHRRDRRRRPGPSGMYVQEDAQYPRDPRYRHRAAGGRRPVRRHGLHLPVQGRRLPHHPLQHA